MLATSPRIQDFLEALFMFFQHKMRYLVVYKKSNQLFLSGWDRKISPLRSPCVITRQSHPHTQGGFLYSLTPCTNVSRMSGLQI